MIVVRDFKIVTPLCLTLKKHDFMIVNTLLWARVSSLKLSELQSGQILMYRWTRIWIIGWLSIDSDRESPVKPILKTKWRSLDRSEWIDNRSSFDFVVVSLSKITVPWLLNRIFLSLHLRNFELSKNGSRISLWCANHLQFYSCLL